MCCRSVIFGMFCSFIAMVLGFSSFICFAFVYHNYSAGIFAFYKAILALIVFHLHRLHSKDALRDWYSIEMLCNIELFALIGLLTGFAMTGWYVFVQAYYMSPIMPVHTSNVIRMVWSFGTFLWGLILFMYCRKYSRSIDEVHVILSNSSRA